jgi:DNA-binding MarR family transcriptional regulator
MTSPAPVSPAVEVSAVEPPAGPRPPDDTPGDVAARVWQAMRTLVLDRYDRRKKVCDALGMSFIRAKALRQVAAGPMTMRELAAGLGTDPPYTTVAVDDLERRGLVVRTVRAGDRRSKLVSITPAGLEQARLASEILNAPPRPVRELPAADLATLDRILSHLAGPEEPDPAS